jgi:hypothetical protein
MKAPIELLMDSVEWKPIQGDAVTVDDGLPIATHEGILRFGDIELKVHQLNDGRRVIDEDSLIALFGGEA